MKELGWKEDLIQQVFLLIEHMEFTEFQGKSVMEASEADALYNALSIAFEKAYGEGYEVGTKEFAS